MWCLETIIAINNELAKGKPLSEAYEACGITLAVRRIVRTQQSAPKQEEAPVWEMTRPPLKAAG